MNLICPSCGQAGGDKYFHILGQQKVLCLNCKAVLKMALKCPACDMLISIPCVPLTPATILKKVLNNSKIRDTSKEVIQCRVCDYKAGIERFIRVVVFKGEYSVIY